MTVAHEEESSLIQVPGCPPREFPGYLLGGVSTQIRDQPRWLEISLYKVTDGTGRYVLHMCGASVVYHKHNGPCNTGVPTSARDMPLDAEPCKICRPGIIPEEQPTSIFSAAEEFFFENLDTDGEDSLLRADDLWDLEQDRYTTYVCKNAEDVVDRLRKPRNSKKQEEGGTLSAPAQRLLDLVAPKDQDIARVVRGVRKI